MSHRNGWRTAERIFNGVYGSKSGRADQYIYIIWEGEWTSTEQKHNQVSFWVAINLGASGDQFPNAFLIWFRGVSKLPLRIRSSARGKLTSSIALEQHAWGLIITGLSVTAPGFVLLGALNYACTQQGLSWCLCSSSSSSFGERKCKKKNTKAWGRPLNETWALNKMRSPCNIKNMSSVRL